MAQDKSSGIVMPDGTKAETPEEKQKKLQEAKMAEVAGKFRLQLSKFIVKSGYTIVPVIEYHQEGIVPSLRFIPAKESEIEQAKKILD